MDSFPGCLFSNAVYVYHVDAPDIHTCSRNDANRSGISQVQIAAPCALQPRNRTPREAVSDPGTWHRSGGPGSVMPPGLITFHNIDGLRRNILDCFSIPLPDVLHINMKDLLSPPQLGIKTGFPHANRKVGQVLHPPIRLCEVVAIKKASIHHQSFVKLES